MKRAWRYYRFVTHVGYSNRDFDMNWRLRTDGCNKAHSTESALRETYEHVLDARHNKPRRFTRIFKGRRIRTNPRDLFSDVLDGTAEAGYIKIHEPNQSYEVFICTTEKGKRLGSFPVGTAFSMIEYILDGYPRLVAIIFTSLITGVATYFATVVSTK